MPREKGYSARVHSQVQAKWKKSEIKQAFSTPYIIQRRLINVLPPELQFAKRHVEESRERESNFEANISRVQANRTYEPRLVHAGNDKAKREETRCHGSYSPREAPGNIPIGLIIAIKVAFPEIEVFNEENGTICARPVADETKEIRERCVEPVGPDDGQW